MNYHVYTCNVCWGVVVYRLSSDSDDADIIAHERCDHNRGNMKRVSGGVLVLSDERPES